MGMSMKTTCVNVLAAALIFARAAYCQDSSVACDIDQGQTTIGGAFDFSAWWARGTCIREFRDDAQCRMVVQNILDNVDSFHSAEYSASATILTLLPTIGAILGSPSSEIWLLLKLVPLGGGLALLLCFGSPIIPEALDKYQDTETMVGSRSRREPGYHGGDDGNLDLAERVSRTVKQNLENKRGISVGQVLFSICILFLLLASAMVSMVIVEMGSVYTTWCSMRLWFHLWYLTLTAVTIVDGWIRVPFDHFQKIYISELPADIRIDSPNTLDSDTDPRFIRQALRALPKTNLYHITSFFSFKRQPKSIAVLISKTSDTLQPSWYGPMRSAIQLFLKLGSITIYIFATSVFSAVVLLALPMAQMALTLVALPGALGGFISEKLTSMIKETGSRVHVVAGSDEEAGRVIMKLLREQNDKPGSFVMEIEDLIFVGGALVARRNPWPRRLLGLLAPSVGFEVLKGVGSNAEPHGESQIFLQNMNPA